MPGIYLLGVFAIRRSSKRRTISKDISNILDYDTLAKQFEQVLLTTCIFNSSLGFKQNSI